MNIKSELQSNNVDLQTVLDKVKSLPDAGSGGSGGGEIKVCEVHDVEGFYRAVFFEDGWTWNDFVSSPYNQIVDLENYSDEATIFRPLLDENLRFTYDSEYTPGVQYEADYGIDVAPVSASDLIIAGGRYETAWAE